ncbi:MAG: NUDIX hydrolase [Ruminococcus sp.]|nr:NUDIX hydrolase [Ruminococcus sp.]
MADNFSQILLKLSDTEWDFTYIDHDREIARAVVFDDDGYLYFVRAHRDDDFGKATIIETSGGGVEKGESLNKAILRELKEELGIEAQILSKIGVVDDYYNLIHRHNINHYFLCKAVSFGDTKLTKEETECFHLSTLKLTYDEAVLEYEKCAKTKIGRLLLNRELPILKRSKEILDNQKLL